MHAVWMFQCVGRHRGPVDGRSEGGTAWDAGDVVSVACAWWFRSCFSRFCSFVWVLHNFLSVEDNFWIKKTAHVYKLWNITFLVCKNFDNSAISFQKPTAVSWEMNDNIVRGHFLIWDVWQILLFQWLTKSSNQISILPFTCSWISFLFFFCQCWWWVTKFFVSDTIRSNFCNRSR